MIISFKPRIVLLYCFLFAGVFNDIIRLGDTQITLFRIMLPFVFVSTIMWSNKARRLYIVFLIIATISFVQSVVFCSFNNAGVRFELSRYLTYLFYYFCIATSIAAVIVISETETELFSLKFETFIILIGVCYLLVFMAIRHFDHARDYLNINNQNDYGAMLAMLCPVFFYKSKSQKRNIYLFFILLVLAYLVLNDCKLALLGVCFQIVLIAYMRMRNRAQNWRFLLFLPALAIVAVFLYYLSDSNVMINGYAWKQTVLEPIRAMLNGELYSQSNTSVTYRVNTFIVSIQWMIKTKFLGIGIGNSGVLVRNLLGSQSLYESWMVNNAVSLHNAFLEIGLEFGFVSLFGLIIVIKSIVRTMRNRQMTNEESCFVVVTISSLLWLQGPSGILVDYLIFVTFTWLTIRNKHIRTERNPDII